MFRHALTSALAMGAAFGVAPAQAEIGSAVIREIVRLAHDGSLATTLQVLQVNRRARRLYERLGFKAFEEVPPHTRMRVQPPTVAGG